MALDEESCIKRKCWLRAMIGGVEGSREREAHALKIGPLGRPSLGWEEVLTGHLSVSGYISGANVVPLSAINTSRCHQRDFSQVPHLGLRLRLRLRLQLRRCQQKIFS